MSTSTETSLSAQVGEFMEGGQQAVADPWPLYSRLRREAPVFFAGDVVLVTRYGDVLQLLQDSRMSTRKYDTDLVDSQIASLSPKDAEIAKEWLGFQKMILGASDPPDHTRRRKLQIHGFMPRQLNAVEDYVRVTTEHLLDRLEKDGEMDFVADFAYQLPMLVIAHMLGVPEEDMPRILSWSQDVGHVMGRGFHHAPERAVGLRGFMDYVTATVEARRTAPRDDLLGALIAAEEEGDKLTTQELIVSFFNLLFSGHETTTTLLANGMLAFLQHPDQWQLLCADPARAADAVEELLRYVTPVSWVTRVALEDVELQGQVIHRGPSIKLVLGSANHDPDHFRDPERFDIDRQDDARGLFFGKGIHYCMGNALARLEATAAFETMARRFPAIRQASDRLEWRPNPLMRRVAALPITVRPSAPA
jgi:cytochrome P450